MHTNVKPIFYGGMFAIEGIKFAHATLDDIMTEVCGLQQPDHEEEDGEWREQAEANVENQITKLVYLISGKRIEFVGD